MTAGPGLVAFLGPRTHLRWNHSRASGLVGGECNRGGEMDVGNTLDAPSALAGPPERHDDLIFDIGMNICEDTDFYLKKGFRVVAVEANPATVEDALRRYPAEIAAGQLTVLNRAISDTRDPLRFYVCRTMSAWSTASTTLRDQWAKQGAEFEEIEVPGTTAADLIAEFGVPHYAKIDIEGFDLICLKGLQKAQAQPDFLSVEVDFFTVQELLSLLDALGYRRFALVPPSAIPDQRSLPVAREGRAVDYEFQRGSSGLFGLELPVPWTDAKSVRTRCAAVVQQYRMSGALGRLGGVPLLGRAVTHLREKSFPLAQDWYDLHAAR
jgi:FkbM family methyltransferase